MYSSSKGTIKLADMRDSALCDRHAKREPRPFSSPNFLPDLLTLIVSLRGGGRPNEPVVFLGNHLVHIRRQVQPGRSLHTLA